MSLEQNIVNSQKANLFGSTKINKGNINEVVNYLNNVRKKIYNKNIERVYHNDVN